MRLQQQRHLTAAAQCMLYALVLFYTFRTTEAYCWEPGWNPYFTEAPRVEQVTISTVRISWKDIVARRECADSFLVKYWQLNMPQGYKLTDMVKTDQNFIEVEVVPKVPYNFQAVAREDKGPVMGVDWNKAPIVSFKTSRLNREVKEEPEPEVDLSTRQPYATSTSTLSPIAERGKAGVVFQGITVELLAIIVVGGFIVILIIIGLIYKCFRSKSVDSSDLDDDPEDPDGKGGGVDDGDASDKDDFDEFGETDNLKANMDDL